jgi:phage gp29-like protein
MDNAIAKVILGQTATTQGTPGKLGGDDAQNDVVENIIKASSDLLCQSFNRGPARWLTEWNFPGARPPRVWRQTEPAEDLNSRAERDERVFALGYRPTLKSVQDTYPGDWELAPKAAPPEVIPGRLSTALDPAVPPEDAEFAEREPRAATKDTVDLQVDRLTQDSTAILDDLMAPIWSLLDQVDSMEELGERIEELYPHLAPDALADLMGDAMTAAQMAGRYDVLRGL